MSRFAARHPQSQSRFYSAGEIALIVQERGLPALPATAKGWTARADREGWPFRARQARGGGKEYPASCLPAEITGEKQAGSHMPNQRLQSAALILGMLDSYALSQGVAVSKCIDAFVLLYNRALIDPAATCRDMYATISAPTLRKWVSVRKRGDMLRLFSNGKRGRESGVTDEMRGAILALIGEHTNITAVQIHNRLNEAFDDAPCLRVVQRFVKNLKTQDRKTYLALTDPDGFKNHYQPAFGVGDAFATHVNAEWQLDSTILDAADDEGHRPTVIGVVDVFTRRAKYLIWDSSSAEGVKALMRAAILDWGVADMIHTDNGKDYISKELKILCGLAGIQHKICTPFSPEQKGHVERMFNTMTTQFCTLLPGYVGRDVADRKKIEAKKSMGQRFGDKPLPAGLPRDEIQMRLNDWVDEYHNRPHPSLDGMTPNEKVQEAQKVRRIEDVRILDVLLTDLAVAGGKRTVSKKGLYIQGVIYNSAELTDYIQQRVVVKLDVEDAGVVWVYSQDGEYLCKAGNRELAGMELQEIALAAKHRSKVLVSAAKAEAKEGEKRLKKAKKHNHAADIRRELADGQGKVVMLPPRVETHDSGAVAAITESFEVTEPDHDAKYARWQEIDAAITRKQAVSEGDRRFHKTYQSHAEFQARCGQSAWG